MQKLLVRLYEDGPKTRHSQELYGSVIGFRLIVKKLKNIDLVQEAGVTEEGRKKYDLTKEALETKKVEDEFEIECPKCNSKFQSSVSVNVNIIHAIKILRMFFGSWQEDKVEEHDDVVECKDCGELYKKNEKICECKKCGKILKW